MQTSIKILILEDNPGDAELAMCQLRSSGYAPSWKRVETEADFIASLDSDLDLVLSDFNLPRFNGMRALELLKQTGLGIPFILISGTIGEDTAVSAMKMGAADYLMKDRLGRLGPAVAFAISERKMQGERQKSALAEQRQLAELRALFDLMPAMVWFKDTEDRILRVNQRVADAEKMPVAAIEGRKTIEIYPEHGARYRAEDLEVIRSGTSQLGKVVAERDSSGIETWYQNDKVPVFDKDGGVVGVVVMAQNITARVKAEEALRESQENFSGAFEHAPIGVALLSVDGRWLKVNRSLCSLLGYSEPELLALSFQQITHPDDLASSREHIRRIRCGEIGSFTAEKRYIHHDGHILTVLLSVSLVHDRKGKPAYLIAQTQDITDMRAAEAAVRELALRTARRERILNTALSSMTDFAQVYDRDGRVLFANQPLLKLWGLTLEDVIGKNFFDLGYPADLAKRLQVQLAQVRDTKVGIKTETSYTSPAGLVGTYEYIFSPVLGNDGAVDFVVGATREITERKRAEESLRASATILSMAQQIAHLGSWELDLANGNEIDSNVLRWSDEMFRIAGLKPGSVEVTNALFFSMVPKEEHEPIRKAVGDAIRSKLPYSFTHRMTRADGEVRTIKESAQIFFNEGDGLPLRIIGTAQDITDQKRLEEQIRQSQKMDAIGTLAGGIAHDFNNILTAINGYTELAQMKVTDPVVRDFLSKVLQAARRATGLVRQILTFSRQQPLERRPLQLLPIVSEALNLLRATIPATIEFDVSLADDTPTVFADPTQMHQIMMNLGTNASHAMKGEPGTLGLRLERFWVDSAFAATSRNLQVGLYARLSVSDTGSGMDQATQRRIFEPFFTTKATGAGTGLGLAVVHGIIDNHDGAITVESKLGKGSVFHVYLPLHDAEVLATADTGLIPRGSGEKILVVDDEQPLAELMKKALDTLGYDAEYTTRPENAVEMVIAEPGRFSLLLTDQTMPGMTGHALATRLQAIRPDMPIVMMTGYSASLTPAKVRAAGIRQVLLKPASLHSLGIAVHAALAEEPDSNQLEQFAATAPSSSCYLER